MPISKRKTHPLSNTAWLKNGNNGQLEHQTAMNKLTGMNELQPTAPGEDDIAKSEAGYSRMQTDDELEILL